MSEDFVRCLDGLMPRRRPESVRVMLPLKDSERPRMYRGRFIGFLKARRRAAWALPGTYVYNLGGWDQYNGSPAFEHPCVLLGYGTEEILGYPQQMWLIVSCGKQIAPQRMRLEHVRGLDDEARDRLASITAEWRLVREASYATPELRHG
jgi:hypothetical protein